MGRLEDGSLCDSRPQARAIVLRRRQFQVRELQREEKLASVEAPAHRDSSPSVSLPANLIILLPVPFFTWP